MDDKSCNWPMVNPRSCPKVAIQVASSYPLIMHGLCLYSMKHYIHFVSLTNGWRRNVEWCFIVVCKGLIKRSQYRVQHCWAGVGWKFLASLNSRQHLPTIIQQSVQTRPTCCINNVAWCCSNMFFWTGRYMLHCLNILHVTMWNHQGSVVRSPFRLNGG